LKKHFVISWFFPFLFSLTLSGAYSFYTNKDYESEWLTPSAAIGMDMMMVIVYGLAMFALALIYIPVSKSETLKKNIQFLIALAIPISSLTLLLLIAGKESSSTQNGYSSLIMIAFFTIPYIVFGILYSLRMRILKHASLSK